MIKLKELREWMDSLPKEFDEFTIANAEVGEFDDVDGKSLSYRLDKPITTLNVDENSKEILFLNETQEEVKKE